MEPIKISKAEANRFKRTAFLKRAANQALERLMQQLIHTQAKQLEQEFELWEELSKRYGLDLDKRTYTVKMAGQDMVLMMVEKNVFPEGTPLSKLPAFLPLSSARPRERSGRAVRAKKK